MSLLDQLDNNAHVLVCGASRGIGLACCERLLTRLDAGTVWAIGRHASESSGLQLLADRHGARLQRINCDARDENELGVLVKHIQNATPSLNLVLCTLGVLQDGSAMAEKGLAQLSLEGLIASFTGNACAPILLIKHLLPLLRGRHPCTFAALSARVGSIGDNRLGGWYSYRASKAALNQLLHTASIELKRLNPHSTVLALHPGTTDTDLSKPFQANVPADKLFTTAFVAERLLELVDLHGPEDTGSFWAWDDSEIVW